MMAFLSVMLSSLAISPLVPPDDMVWLRELAVAVVDASRVAPDASVGEFGPNTSGGTLIRPGGRNAYPAFWIRDYAMSLDCGLIPASEQRHMLLHTAAHQQDELKELPTGSILPPGSILLVTKLHFVTHLSWKLRFLFYFVRSSRPQTSLSY